MKALKVVSSFIFLVLFFGAVFIFGKPSDVSKIPNFKINGVEINVELASTPEARAQGLSGRASLGENEGMLFIFEKPGKYDFWMKDMNFPIDIIWLASDLRVVYIKKDARPESYPESFVSNEEAKYVLEVVSGFSDKYNLQIWDRAEFKY